MEITENEYKELIQIFEDVRNQERNRRRIRANKLYNFGRRGINILSKAKRRKQRGKKRQNSDRAVFEVNIFNLEN